MTRIVLFEGKNKIKYNITQLKTVKQKKMYYIFFHS